MAARLSCLPLGRSLEQIQIFAGAWTGFALGMLASDPYRWGWAAPGRRGGRADRIAAVDRSPTARHRARGGADRVGVLRVRAREPAVGHPRHGAVVASLTRWTDDWLDENMGSSDVRVETVQLWLSPNGRSHRRCGAAPREIFASFAKGWSAARYTGATFLRAHRDPRTSGLAFIAETALPPELSRKTRALPEFASFLGEPEHVQLCTAGRPKRPRTPIRRRTCSFRSTGSDRWRTRRRAPARPRRLLPPGSLRPARPRPDADVARQLPPSQPVRRAAHAESFVDDQFGSPRQHGSSSSSSRSPAIMEVTLLEGDVALRPELLVPPYTAQSPAHPPSCRSVAVNIWYTGASAAFSAVMAFRIQEGRCRAMTEE